MPLSSISFSSMRFSSFSHFQSLFSTIPSFSRRSFSSFVKPSSSKLNHRSCLILSHHINFIFRRFFFGSGKPLGHVNKLITGFLKKPVSSLPTLYISRCTAVQLYNPSLYNKQSTFVNNKNISTITNDVSENFINSVQNLNKFFPKQTKAVSGIMCLSDDLRIALEEKSEKGEMVREYVLTMLGKVLYYSFKTDDIKENLKNLIDVFRDIDYKKNKILFNFFDDKKEITLIQNLLTFIWAHHAFDYNLLEEIAGPHINVESYKKAELCILQFIEIHFLKNALFNEQVFSRNVKLRNIKAVFINPENTIEYYCKNESMKQCNQKNADFLLINESDNMIKYVDTKSFVSNVIFNTYNRISVIQKNKGILLREINNMVTGLHNLSQEIPYIFIYYEKTKTIQSSKKAPEEMFLAIYDIILSLYTSPNDQHVKISLANILKGTDNDFLKMFALEMKYIINNEKKTIEYVSKMFPKNSCIDSKEQKVVVKYFIDKLFPNSFKEIKENARKIMQETLFIEQ